MQIFKNCFFLIEIIKTGLNMHEVEKKLDEELTLEDSDDFLDELDLD